MDRKLCLDICKHYDFYLPHLAKSSIGEDGKISWTDVFKQIIKELRFCKQFSTNAVLNKELYSKRFRYKVVKDAILK